MFELNVNLIEEPMILRLKVEQAKFVNIEGQVFLLI